MASKANKVGQAAALMPDVGQILDGIGFASYVWHIDTDALTWSENAAGLFAGVDIEALAHGRAFAALIAPQPKLTRNDAIMASTKIDAGHGVSYIAEYALNLPGGNGAPVWVEDCGCWFAGSNGKPVRAHGLIRIINERHSRETELEHLAQHDPLTGELNRHSLGAELEKSLAEAIRAKSSFAFVLIAIDHLARLNDAFGFSVADEVIHVIGQRLRARLRGSDCLGRFSGNKFGLILKNCTPDDLNIATDRFLACIRDEVVLTSSGAIAVTASIGGVIAPRHGQNVHDVMSRAHEALDHAKSRRRGSFMAWRPSVEREAARRTNVRTTAEIVSALNERRVVMAFEPVVHAATRKTAFYEGLLRLRREDGEIMLAPEIVPVAEKLGLIRLVDHRVLELVVNELADTPAIHLSLNISPDTTVDVDWWCNLEALLRNQPGVAERMIIEITETAEIQNLDDLRGFVSRVKDFGGRIAIDDFGAGFTSFRNLRRLGVDIVKIDGAFVQNITQSEDDRIFVHTLLDMAQRLGLKTVAEWVQSEPAAQLLREWGCDYLQGKLIGLGSIERPWRTADLVANEAMASTG